MAPKHKAPRLVSWLPCQSHEPVIVRDAAPFIQAISVPPISVNHRINQSETLAIALQTPKSRGHARAPHAVCVPKLLAARKDAPYIRSTRVKGCIEKAFEACDTAGARDEALNTYESRTRAESSHSGAISHWHTWQRVHERWFGFGPDALPCLPLTVESIRAVSSALLHGEYRSVPNYVTFAKDQHFKAGHPWTTDLEREQHRSNAACTRGLGPAHQCEEIPLMLVFPRAHLLVPLDTDPLGHKNLIVIASFYMLREIEASLIVVRCLTIVHSTRTVKLLLPATKTDPTAHTTTRCWGCVCDGDFTVPCPFHAAVSQLELSGSHFGVHDDVPLDWPLFPDHTGKTVSKEHFTSMVERLANICDLPLKAADGGNAFGGHVWRLVGARHMPRMLVPVNVFKLLARWQTDIIDRYLREVPLENLTAVYRASLLSSSSSSTQPAAPPLPAPAVNQPLAICDASSVVGSTHPPKNVGCKASEAGILKMINEAIVPLVTQLNSLTPPKKCREHDIGMHALSRRY